jgi:alpha-galactosidase
MKDIKNLKLAYIGGGSKQWARIFMNDLALDEDMCGTIYLYDIDNEAAKLNKEIGNKIASHKDCKSKWKYEVSKTIDEALMGADFVIISILPGTFKEMHSDVHEPEKYGIYQPVGDTTGPGGVLRAMRTVPIYEYFAKKIKEICSESYVINFTNPMAICVKTLYDVFPEIKAFGCCHEVFNTQDFLCAVLKETLNIEVKRREIYTNVIGINHFTWIDKATYKDINIMSLLDEFLDRYYESGYSVKGDVDAYKTNPFAYSNRVKMDLYKRYGALGAAGDRHLVEFLNNNWYLKDKKKIEEWKFNLTSVDFRINRMEQRIKDTIELANGTKEIELKQSSEEAVDLMKAILGLSTMVSNVNLPNVGQIKDLPKGAIVETNALFTHNQIVPLYAGKLNDEAHNLVLRNLINQEGLYEAIKARDLNKIFNIFVNQPLCSTLTIKDAKELFKSMVFNTQKYLGDYYSIFSYYNQ